MDKKRLSNFMRLFRTLLLAIMATQVFAIALCVAPASAGQFAYVTNSNSNTVSVISTATNTVTATVPVGSLPYFVAITPNGEFTYVTNSNSNTVSVISTATNTVIATVPVGSAPIGIAIMPNGEFAYVTNSNSNTVSVISTATNTVTATVPVGSIPYGVAITPNGEFTYVTNSNSNTVSVISTATNTVIATVPVGSIPLGVAITPNGQYAYVTNQISNTVSVISTATNTVIATVPVGFIPSGVAITPNGEFAYVTHAYPNTPVSVISTATDTVTATVPVGSLPYGVAITPNGEFTYVTNSNSNTVSVISTATNTVIATVPVGSIPLGVAISPSGVQLPQTGQTTCYDSSGNVMSCSGVASDGTLGAGQDGALQMGIAWPSPRFTTNADSTLTDNLTTLIWAPDGSTPTVGSCTGGALTFQGALAYVQCLNTNNYLGHNDWRLPNVNELASIVNGGQSNPATWLNGLGFINVQSNDYWSSTSYAGSPTLAWFVYMYDGLVDSFYKSFSFYVWPVRGGQGTSVIWRTGQATCYDPTGNTTNTVACAGTGQDGELQKGVAWPSPRFTDNGNTVSDNLTNLMWVKDGSTPTSGSCSGGMQTWQQALNYVSCLNTNNYLGHNDWRLPNDIELRSLNDFSQYCPALPSGNPFSNVQPVDYWSSTSYANDPSNAWYVTTYDGLVVNVIKSYNVYVWPVRGGQSSPSPVNGVCGSSNGQTLTSVPTTNLCSTGTASAVSGTGPWSWTCAGSNGGTTASCSANIQTYSISGSVSTSSGTALSGVTIKLSGTSSATATTNSSGSYSFTGLLNGSYTVAPNMVGYTFSPMNITLSVSSANVTGQNFTGTATTASTVPIPNFTWMQANKSGLVNFDGSYTYCPANVGSCTYSWVFGDGTTDNSNTIKLSHTYPSTVGSTTYKAVLTVSNANGSPSTSSTVTVNVPPTVSSTVTMSGLTVTLTDSSTLGASITINWGDGSTQSTGSAGGTFTHTYASANTYTIVATATVGVIIASEDLHVTVPTKYSVSGTVTDLAGTPLQGVELALINSSGITRGIATTDINGNYTFVNVVPSTYTITAVKTWYTFANPAATVTVTNGSVTGVNITGTFYTTFEPYQ